MNKKNEKDTAIDDALAKIHKKYGKESIMELEKKTNSDVQAVSTGCFALDEAFGCGGLPRGRIIEAFGEESCLAGDTFISYQVRDKNGITQNFKGETIDMLYSRFRGGGAGNYHRGEGVGYVFFVSSINENNEIIENKVNDVVFCGVKECFKLTTVGKKSIVCTKDHKFYIGNGKYLPLEDLSVGSVIYVHDNTLVKKTISQTATEDIIKDITKVGEIPTFDIKCQSPYNNYVANKIVVHNSGKSTLATFLMAQIQKKGGRVALIDAEFAFDAEYARAIGLDVNKLILSQPGCLEEAMDILSELVKSKSIDIIVIDSVAALVPRAEIEGEEMLKETMALQARLMGKALRILTGSISRSGTIVIFINQVRDKVGLVFGKKETTPGGKALKFFSSIRIEIKRGDKLEGKNKELIGYRLKAKMVKNKVGFPWREAIFDLYFGSGIDLTADLFSHAEKNDVIQKQGNTYSYNKKVLGVGRDKAISAITNDAKLFEEIKKILEKKQNEHGKDE